MLTLLLTAVCVAPSAGARACVCAGPSAERAAPGARAVFVGTVEAIDRDVTGAGAPRRARLRVDSAWRWPGGGARPPATLTVLTSQTTCGLAFKPGDVWLGVASPADAALQPVLAPADTSAAARAAAYVAPDALTAERCSGSAPLTFQVDEARLPAWAREAAAKLPSQGRAAVAGVRRALGAPTRPASAGP